MAEILSSSQLVEQAKEEYRSTFGSVDICVVAPPELVLETQKVAEGKGYGFFAPLYFPFGETRLDLPSPEGWVKLQEGFFNQMEGNKPNVSPDAARIGPYWTLFDESKRPEFSGDEKFGIILTQGRDSDRIGIPDHVKYLPKTSRFGVSMDEQDGYVFPELAKPLRLVEQIAQGLVVIRRPKAAEFNFAGNLRYKHLGGDPTWEGFDDHFEGADRLVGGDSDYGGLSYARYGWPDRHYGAVAFRPLVIFLFQPQSLITW